MQMKNYKIKNENYTKQNDSIQVKVKCQYILYYLHVNDARFRIRERCLLK